MHCLPNSTPPSDLGKAGYEVIEACKGERLIAGSIASGALELLTPGSTKPVATTVTHAGIVAVERYEATLSDHLTEPVGRSVGVGGGAGGSLGGCFF